MYVHPIQLLNHMTDFRGMDVMPLWATVTFNILVSSNNKFVWQE